MAKCKNYWRSFEAEKKCQPHPEGVPWGFICENRQRQNCGAHEKVPCKVSPPQDAVLFFDIRWVDFVSIAEPWRSETTEKKILYAHAALCVSWSSWLPSRIFDKKGNKKMSKVLQKRLVGWNFVNSIYSVQRQFHGYSRDFALYRSLKIIITPSS